MTKIGKTDWTALRTGKNAKHTRMYKKTLRVARDSESYHWTVWWQLPFPIRPSKLSWASLAQSSNSFGPCFAANSLPFASSGVLMMRHSFIYFPFCVCVCVYVVSLFLRRLGPTKWDPSPFWWSPFGFPRFHSLFNGPTELATKVLTCVLRACNSPGSRPWK